MEAIVKPMTWDDWPEGGRGIFQGFRSEKGEDLVLNRNMFVEGVLPSSILRDLSEEEMDQYRAPFKNPEDRQPTLNWPRTDTHRRGTSNHGGLGIRVRRMAFIESGAEIVY